MNTTANMIEITASVTAEQTSDGLTYRAGVTAGPAEVSGLFAYGETPTSARRALAELVPGAIAAGGGSTAGAEYIALTVPETYWFALSATV